MDRRETIKAMILGSVAGTAAIAVGCEEPKVEEVINATPDNENKYGRTLEEKKHDERLLSMDSIFTQNELETVGILCDIILPASKSAGSATEARVVEFIDFIVKEIPNHQLPLKGGLMWLNRESNLRYNKEFNSIEESQKIAIIDEIAYPERAKEQHRTGVNFFNLMRNLTLTGYYTSKMGIEDLGYKGNMPNVWDGVPEEVLKQHNVSYDPDWIAKCVDQSRRNIIAEWDEDGNLLT